MMRPTVWTARETGASLLSTHRRTGAPLHAAARPVEAQSAQDFVERMKGLAGRSSDPSRRPLSLPEIKCGRTGDAILPGAAWQ